MTKVVKASQDRELQDDEMVMVSGGDFFGLSEFSVLINALSNAQKAIGDGLKQAAVG